MSESNQATTKNYPIFKAIPSEDCIALLSNKETCEISDIKLEVVGIKTLEESYILEYHCSEKAMLINALIKANIAPECQEDKFPLDAFLIDKTGIDTGNAATNSETYQEEEMPATDYCNFKNPTTDKYLSDCGKMIHGIPYTNYINGYRLIPITSENRAEIYAEFEAKGYRYEASQAAMSIIADDAVLIANAALTDKIANAALLADKDIKHEEENNKQESHSSDSYHAWCEYLTGDIFNICDFFA